MAAARSPKPPRASWPRSTIRRPSSTRHPLSFELANKLKELTPAGLDHVFFTGSGSEAADTSLKMARAYWRAKGQASKTRLIGREKGYHGVNFGGISVGGIVGQPQGLRPGIEADHLPHTMLADNAFSRGMPDQGAELADDLLNLIALHDASNIAAVIVEPMAGSAGVIVPPQGYLQRLRDICTAHNILLIFDEVITGFGRTGALTGAEAFGVTPDIMNVAKQVTNGAQPLGAVLVKKDIYDTFIAAGRPGLHARVPARLHLLGAPVACAVGLAALDVLVREEHGRPREGHRPALRERGAQPQGREARHRHPQLRTCGRPDDRRACRASRRAGPTKSPWRCGRRASTCATAATPSSWRRPSSSSRPRSTA
jgi:adenosylmethionine-8-amino-7-oxononanoate aminotransferase